MNVSLDVFVGVVIATVILLPEVEGWQRRRARRGKPPEPTFYELVKQIRDKRRS